MGALVSFFVDNFPTLRELALQGPPGLAFAYAGLWLAGLLKKRKGLKTGYTRKIYHFLIFFTAASIQWFFGLRSLCIFGGAVSIVVLYAVLRGDGHILYEAIAREKDAPKRTFYIVAPYIATLVGGIAANVLFGDGAIVGYLVTGLADAVAEPVGTRFGRHPYKVPAIGVAATRSYEGSAAVCVASLACAAGAVFLRGELGGGVWLPLNVAAIALASTLTEAISPHGWDNLTMQLIPSFLAYVLL
jgi:phytol kinase